ncbi:MAG TPA: phosphate acyltransferase [bacterium]|jgi:phosphate butyryltransferase
MLTTARHVMDHARDLAKKKMPIVAVAGGEDGDVLRAVADAQKEGYVHVHLVGSEAKVRAGIEKLNLDPKDFTVTHADGVKAVVAKAVDLCSTGQCQILMKGKVPTSDLMKAVLAPNANLRKGKLLSHCATLEVPGHTKLLTITDGGVLSAPDFHQKVAIVENAVRVCRYLGIADPKVALLGVLDEADPDFPSTIETSAIARTCFVRGICKYIEGPLTMRTVMVGPPKGTAWQSDVIGDPDIMVSHGIEEANIAVKALIHLRGAIFMGVITGARVPLSLVSRSDPPMNKMASLALAAVMAGEEARS